MAQIAEAAAASARTAPKIRPRQVAAAVAGNWLEFYDFIIFAQFAVQIGNTFFPDNSEFAREMLTWGAFGAGFVFRPIGAVVIGRFADRAGRRPAMLLSFALMGVALLGLVLTPSYRSIGLAAPLLAVGCRLLQGFALGGEVGPTTAFLIEAAPLRHRGLYGSWQSASQSIASFSGGLAGFVVAHLLTTPDLNAFGWRIALGLGVLVLPFGLMIRRTLPETRGEAEPALAAHPDAAPGAGLGAQLASHGRILVLGLGLIAGGTISTYVFTYMTSFAQTTLHFDPATAFLMTACIGAAGFAASLAGGALSDRLGRRALMVWPRFAFLLTILPIFILITRIREGAVLIGLMTALNVVANLTGVPALVALTESLRKEVRGLATGTVYACAVAFFGGTTPLVVTWLGAATRNPLAPAWYLMLGTLVALVASIAMVETAGPRAPAPRES
ncbi:MAG TPA: MFS transporter [Caulobacteraceae bacterium]|nr:MFS transporter [Caulobacteraceae bacterium]